MIIEKVWYKEKGIDKLLMVNDITEEERKELIKLIYSLYKIEPKFEII